MYSLGCSQVLTRYEEPENPATRKCSVLAREDTLVHRNTKGAGEDTFVYTGTRKVPPHHFFNVRRLKHIKKRTFRCTV